MSSEAKRNARQLILDAVDQAKRSGEISAGEAFAIRLTSRLRRRKFNRVAGEVATELAGELSIPPPKGSDAEDLALGWEFDIEQWRKLLDLLLEYLPKILALFL